MIASVSCARRIVHRPHVVRTVRDEGGEVACILIQERRSCRRVVGMRISQYLCHDHASPIDTEMKLPPARLTLPSVPRSHPLTFTSNGETRAVDDEIDGSVSSDSAELDVDLPTSARQRRVVRRLEIQAHQAQAR